MIQIIKMPDAGQTTDVAKILSVSAKEGDTIKRGDIIVNAETDKANLPVESYASGIVLEICVKPDQDVHAGDVIAVVGNEEDKSSYKKGTAHSSTELPSKAAISTTTEKAFEIKQIGSSEDADGYQPIMIDNSENTITTPPSAPNHEEKYSKYPVMPNAKYAARENDIDLKDIIPANGTFITRKDILAKVKSLPTNLDSFSIHPISRARAIIGRRMLQSVNEIPVWQSTVHVDMSAVELLRNDVLENYKLKLSYNDIIAKAVAVASRDFPLINARYEKEEIHIYTHTNIGLAVSLDESLLVPVLKGVDLLSLEEINMKYKELIKKARDNRLSPEEMGCGSITISNLGMYKTYAFSAIINPPESCILAVGSITTSPIWDGTQFVPKPIMSITGSFDHRMIDGAYGAKFLQQLVNLLENPSLMLI